MRRGRTLVALAIGALAGVALWRWSAPAAPGTGNSNLAPVDSRAPATAGAGASSATSSPPEPPALPALTDANLAPAGPAAPNAREAAPVPAPDRAPDLRPTDAGAAAPPNAVLPARTARVVDERGDAIPGARVGLWPHDRMGLLLYSTLDPQPGTWIEARADGLLEIAERPGAHPNGRAIDWWAEPQADGCVPPESDTAGWVRVPADPAEPLVLVLRRGGYVECRPVDPRTQRAPAQAAFRGPPAPAGRPTHPRWDDVRDGVLRCGPFAPGPLRVTVEASGHPPAGPFDVMIRAGEATDLGVVVLPVGATLRGTLHAPDGQPPGRARVRLVAHRGVPRAGWQDQAGVRGVSPETSSFGLGGIPAGIYDVRVNSDRFAPLIQRGVALADGDAVDLPLHLEPAAHVVLRLVDAAGAPVPGWALRVGHGEGHWVSCGTYLNEHERLPDRRLGWDDSVATNPNGRAGCNPLQAGTWPVEARDMQRPDQWHACGTITVVAGDNGEVTVRLP